MMNKRNVLLFEKHDVAVNEFITPENKQPIKVKGLKIYRIVQPKLRKDGTVKEYKTLTTYDAKKDRTDLQCLADKSGFFLVCVDKTPYNTFVWSRYTISDPVMDDNNNVEVVNIVDARQCTSEEADLLNELFPEYLEKAF